MDGICNDKIICQNCQHRQNKKSIEIKAGFCSARGIFVPRKDTQATVCKDFVKRATSQTQAVAVVAAGSQEGDQAMAV